MRLSALVVDLAVLGPRGWDYLERVCEALPGLGIVVCTGPVDGRPARARAAAGRRRLADEAVPPGGADRARRGRRAPPPPHASARAERAAVAAGELEIRSDRFQAFVDGRSVDLTRREFELIELLAGAEGRVLEREEIYQRVWGYAMARGDRSVDVFVRKLRQKLEKASPEWRYIHTHFGVGYRFAAGSSRRGRADAAPAAGAGAEAPPDASRPSRAERRGRRARLADVASSDGCRREQPRATS